MTAVASLSCRLASCSWACMRPDVLRSTIATGAQSQILPHMGYGSGGLPTALPRCGNCKRPVCVSVDPMHVILRAGLYECAYVRSLARTWVVLERRHALLELFVLHGSLHDRGRTAHA